MGKTKHKKPPIDGKTWLKYSISIWNDIRKTSEELKLKHSALYPVALVRKLLQCYYWEKNGIVLDPFVGSGSTLVAAVCEKLNGIGFEVVPSIAKLALERLKKFQLEMFSTRDNSEGNFEFKVEYINKPQTISFPSEKLCLVVVEDDVRKILSYLMPSSIDIVITSPPYWNVHTRNRSVDRKKSRPYSYLEEDLGNIKDYNIFLQELIKIFRDIFVVLKSGSYCIINVMDLRQGNNFVPYHVDIIQNLINVGFKIEDIIIWNRASEYNNLRPIGYPYKFIINKVHEYILIFKKPIDSNKENKNV